MIRNALALACMLMGAFFVVEFTNTNDGVERTIELGKALLMWVVALYMWKRTCRKL